MGDWIPLTKPYFSEQEAQAATQMPLSGDKLPVTEPVSRSLVRLPLYSHLTPAQLQSVADAVYEFFDGPSRT